MKINKKNYGIFQNLELTLIITKIDLVEKHFSSILNLADVYANHKF